MKLEEDRRRLVDAINTTFSNLGSAAASLLTDRDKMLGAVGGLSLLALGVYSGELCAWSVPGGVPGGGSACYLMKVGVDCVVWAGWVDVRWIGGAGMCWGLPKRHWGMSASAAGECSISVLPQPLSPQHTASSCHLSLPSPEHSIASPMALSLLPCSSRRHPLCRQSL